MAEWHFPFDVSMLTEDQAGQAKEAMRLWMDTGANIQFIPRTEWISDQSRISFPKS